MQATQGPCRARERRELEGDPAVHPAIGNHAARQTARFAADRPPDMNRRYAYRDYAILVTALPAGDAGGWRPEICVIAPDDRWQFVPTHHSLVANDPQYCLEIGRLCAERAIQSKDATREKALYASALLH
jgi:hypothetical protein